MKDRAKYRSEFHNIKEELRDSVRAEVRRRAIDGWDEPLFYAGKQCGSIKKYSDSLLIMLARAHCPEFRDRIEIQHPGNWDKTLRVEFVQVDNSEARRDKVCELVKNEVLLN